MAGGVITSMAVLSRSSLQKFRALTATPPQVVVGPQPPYPPPQPPPSPPGSNFFIQNGDPVLLAGAIFNFTGDGVLPPKPEQYGLNISKADNTGVSLWWTYPPSVAIALSTNTQQAANLITFGLYLQRSTTNSSPPNAPNFVVDLGPSTPPVPPTANGWATIASWINPGSGTYAPPTYTVNNPYLDPVVPTITTYYRLVLLFQFTIIV